MDTSSADLLPEAHSLPDGFVESSADPLLVSSPRVSDYKEMDGSDEPIIDVLSDSLAATVLPADKAVDTNKRTYSVPSQENGASGEEGNQGLVLEQIEEIPQASRGIISPQFENLTASGHEQAVGDCLNSEHGGLLELSSLTLKERSAADSECLNTQKPESSETKRKVVKRSIKSEKELLELTLKYQKVIAERDAAIAVRERLESLCRELQRQNKMLMGEYQRVSTEGQTMSLDLSTKFNDMIKNVSDKLEKQKDESLAQLKENEMLRNKLKELADHYTLSEQQFAQKLKQKTLELEIADLKIQQYQERSAQEQTQMHMYAEQVAQLLATEKNLRLQLAADGEKFQQFQDALLKSNEVFETFKQEMEKMSKLIKDFKKENAFLKGKCEKSDFSLVKLVEERELMKKQLEKTKNQKEKLESLCRSLQAERKQYPTGDNNSGSVTSETKTGSMEEDS